MLNRYTLNLSKFYKNLLKILVSNKKNIYLNQCKNIEWM